MLRLDTDIPWEPALRALEQAGVPKRTIAEEIGVDWRTIHRLVRGEHHPRRTTLLGIVRVATARGLLAA